MDLRGGDYAVLEELRAVEIVVGVGIIEVGDRRISFSPRLVVVNGGCDQNMLCSI